MQGGGRRACGVRRAHEVGQVRVFRLVEMQSARDPLEHALGDAARDPPLEPRVVLDADPGQ